MKKNDEVLNRIPQLDGIRGMAVLMVVLDHASYWYHHPPEQISMLSDAHGPFRAVLAATSAGWLGVDLFFILSGYLITSILLKTREADSYFQSFYARRVLRIFPVFWLTLIALAIVFPHSPGFFVVSVFFMANMTNFFGIPDLYYPLWSLCVEEHFYLLWPLVVRLFRRRILFGVCVAICAIEPVLRAIVAWKMGARFFDWPLYFSAFRFEGLAYGAILAMAAQRLSGSQRVKLGLAAMFCGIAILAAGIPFGILHSSSSMRATVVHASAGLTFAAVFFFGLVCLSLGLTPKAARIFANRPLMLLGELSYCLYLIHQLVFWGWDHWLDGLRIGSFAGRPFAYFLVRLAGCAIVSGFIALLSRRFIENPVLSLKRYFPANRNKHKLEQSYQPV